MKTIKILSVDVGKNGLHAEAFAVGAVVLNGKGEVIDSFRARCPMQGEPRGRFVKEEILPALRNYTETHDNVRTMRVAFWSWFQKAREDAMIFADCGWPSEARFFIALAEDDFEERYLNGPRPLHDVATLFLAVGVDPVNTDRRQYVADLLGGRTGIQHDPWWDAFVSGLCALKALVTLGRISATGVA